MTLRIVLTVSACTLLACGGGEISPSNDAGNVDGGAASLDATPSDGDVDARASLDANVGDGAPGSDGDVTRELTLPQLCNAVTHDICLALITCLGRDYVDIAECESDQFCSRILDLQMEISSGWASYDAAAAGACDARFASAPCDFASDYLFVPTVHEVLAQCPGVVVGHQSAGSPCASGLDCTPDNFCSMMARTCPGTCMPYGRVGDPCSFGVAVCDPSLVCRSGHCAAHLVAGDACTAATSPDCLNDGLWCDTALGQCRAPVGAGATCSWNGASCAAPTTCVQTLATPGTCRLPGDAGASCGNPRDCNAPLVCYQPSTSALGTCRARADVGGACADAGDCGANLRCVSNVCAARAGVGEACTTGLFAEPCASGLACDGSVCRDARHAGEPCDATGVCVASVCHAGTCVVRAAVGASCTTNEDCVSQTCTSMLCVDPNACR